MKIYVAGASSEMNDRAKPVIKRLKELGHSITFDWTEVVDMYEDKQPSSDILEQCAVNDFVGVKSAEALVLLAPQSMSTGAWVELGMAISLDMPVYISGPSERCIFTFMNDMYKFKTDVELLKYFEF